MSRARLKALKLVGFKSFADKTTVEFGPGISAVIGPNGSGKSNLADALRWSLGEQGRTLRTRRAEDLIFAGSSVRRAQGMADVTLVIDNEDRLLPLDFAEIELGRRLFRSGENEYLVNRQKIRLRDLVDLLDEANLADNAFLFIGQGMVDQALALRPEERRPLFEEAAGTRKHERRRRAAESELTEAEANLERVRDLLGELRPQARRLAAQAEQQTQRRDAGRDLAAALVAVARERLGSAERQTIDQRAALERTHRESDAALAALRAAEETAQAITHGLADRAVAEATLRAALDVARGRVVEARLVGTRLNGDAESLRRDRARLSEEQGILRGRLEAASRDLALPVAEPDEAAEDGMRDAERRLADAVRSLAEAREVGRSDEQRLRRLRQEREARLAEAGRIRQRAVDAARKLAEAETAAAAAAQRTAAAEQRREAATAEAARTTTAETASERAADVARAEVATAEARARETQTHEASARSEVAALKGRAAALDQLLAIGRSETLVVRIRQAGGRAVTVGLEVEPGLRRAVEAALGEVLAGHVVPPAAVEMLKDVGGALVLAEAPVRPARDREQQLQEARAAAVSEAAAAVGGGLLAAGLRRDPGGLVGRLLAQAAWVPDLGRAVTLATSGVLGVGWSVATPAGEVVTHDGVVRLAGAASLLERRAERSELDPALEAAAAAAERAGTEVRAATAALSRARQAADAARVALESARRARRVADEAERAAARGAETGLRESQWAATQLERARAMAASAEAERAAVEEEVRAVEREAAAADADQGDQVRAEIAALDAQVGALTRERERWAQTVRASRERLDADRERRRRAELRIAMDGARNEELERDLGRLVGAEADLASHKDANATALAEATAEDARAATSLRALEASGSDDRARLVAAEKAANEARERLRTAEARARAVEVRMLEVRVQLDAAREGLLVELAAIGPEGLAALHAEVAEEAQTAPAAAAMPPGGPAATATLSAGPSAELDPEQAAAAAASVDDDRTAALEAALDRALDAWRAGATAGTPLPGIAAPGSGRLAALRRRYHELGSGNPYAAEELAELSVRLDALETQRSDLETAIRSTRELIARLEGLITEQFRTTFAALEDAFARRFKQLFDGGEAQLSLTAPDDLASTGVEITARPPGKKRQPLAMLSGGERSLTAVALLLAMLEVRPVPFCVLDEVDAALDEANVGRFSAALRTLAEHIQFVVITHNRGTIEAADALYGVTVGDDAVSRVISLRLGDSAVDAAIAPAGLAAPALDAIQPTDTIGSTEETYA